jgi:hypothetical protein
MVGSGDSDRGLRCPCPKLTQGPSENLSIFGEESASSPIPEDVLLGGGVVEEVDLKGEDVGGGRKSEGDPGVEYSSTLDDGGFIMSELVL